MLYFKRKDQYNSLKAKQFLKIVGAGFISPRKKLLSNLANTLGINKELLLSHFKQLDFRETVRAEELGMEKWQKLIEKIGK